MPDQVQNPNIKFQDQGLTPVTPGIDPVVPAADPPAPPIAPVEPVPLPKATDVETPALTVAPEGLEGKEGQEGQKAAEPHPLFEKPAMVTPGAKSEQRTENREQRKLPKKMIAGIAALVFLVVGGLGTGLYLLGQRQEVRTLAEGCHCASGSEPGYDCVPNREQCGENGFGCCPSSGGGGGGGGGGTCPAPDTNTGACAIYRCYGGCSGICEENRGDIGCDQTIGSQCGQIDEECRRPDNTTYWRLKDGELNCSGSCSGGGGTPTEVPTQVPTQVPTKIPPTATPTQVKISANCQSLVGQISDGAGGWVSKTDAEFVATARPGDRVRFVCTGHKTQGNFTKSAFFINNVLHVDDVVKLNDTQFAVEYTIGAAGALKVESVLLHDNKGWVD